MNVLSLEIGSVVIARLEGRLTIEMDTKILQELLGELLTDRPRNVVLDLGGVSRLDCAGIGQLVTYYHRVKDIGGTLKLLHLDERVRRMLEMTKLLTIIEAFDNEAEAVGSISDGREKGSRNLHFPRMTPGVSSARQHR